MVLDTYLLNTQQYKGEVEQSFATPRCSSYWKGSLLVALDYSRQLTLLERMKSTQIETYKITDKISNHGRYFLKISHQTVKTDFKN